MSQSRPSQDIFNWKCLMQVVQKGSLRKAAAGLGLDASSLSKRLKLLSLDLGVELYENSKTGLALTQKGRVALKNFSFIVNAYDIAVTNLERNQGVETKTLRIVAPIGYSLATVETAVRMFQEDFPWVNFWLESVRYGAEDFENLGHGVDMIISTIRRDNSFYETLQINEHASVCVTSPGYLRKTRISEPEDLHRCNLGGQTLFISKMDFENLKTKEKVVETLNFKVLSDNSYLLLQWAASGAGVAVGVPMATALDKINSGELVVVLPQWKIPNNHVYSYLSKKTVNQPKTMELQFFEYLKKVADGNGAVADAELEKIRKRPLVRFL